MAQRKLRKHNPYPNLTVTISLTIALFLIGLCGLLTLSGRKLSELVKQNLEMQVYVADEETPGQRDAIYQTIVQKPYVLVQNGTPQVRFVSKEEAAEKFIRDTKEDFNELLGENPLLDAYNIKVTDAYFSEAQLNIIQQDLEKMDGVREADFVRNFADEVNRNFSKIYLVLSVFVSLLLIIIVLLVNNTIKLSLYSQRFLIRSMQLVGATHNFIRRPFLSRGALQGLISAVIACAMLFGLLQLANANVPELRSLQDTNQLLLLGAILVGLGVLIGVLSTFQSVERYLRLSLDELY
ncbi:MAG: permease-like cell division protein FtsX [Cytophagaceae bacterium]|nr:permease-like cell division protein FtsX [Cytophagaceae bacterium]